MKWLETRYLGGCSWLFASLEMTWVSESTLICLQFE